MKRWMQWPMASMVALCVACAPLQQAPLVYSSKLIVGVDISANASESPGAAVNIGVKSVDAAYVPIAVSKALDPNGKRTDEATMAIERIFAEYGEGDSGKSSQALTEANKAKIVAYLEAWKSQNEAQARVQATQVPYEQTNTKLEQMKSLRDAVIAAQQAPSPVVAASGAASNDGSAIVDSLNKRANALEVGLPKLAQTDGAINFDDVLKKLKPLISETTTYVDSQKQAFDAAQKTLTAAKQLADERFVAAAQAASLVSTKKSDALSVYGRFDSNGSASATTGTTTAPATSGSVLVGKVFSTGLASQNLTEAVMIEARSKCVINALQVAGALTDPEQKKQFLEKLDGLCLTQGREAGRR